MQIVMTYTVSDGYTFSCTETVPLEYESVEQAIVDFEDLLRRSSGDFQFAGKSFHISNFYYMKDKYELPEFMTVDEWFRRGE